MKEPVVEEIKEPEVPKTAAQLAMERMDRLLASSAQAQASNAVTQDKIQNLQESNKIVLGQVAVAEEINASIDRIWKEKFGGPSKVAA